MFPVPDAVLPEEITKELESMVDDARKSRIERLEKLRRREDVLPGEDEDDDDVKCDQPLSLHESAESSVEGFILMFLKVLYLLVIVSFRRGTSKMSFNK
jgi:hypothetical protein